MPLEIHCHNDLGLVVANSIAGARAASDAGVDSYINTCVNGMGERAGNADLVSVILACKYGNNMKDYELDEKINLKTAWKICKYASYAFGVPIPINQPGIGANAFAHESGIHADGALKDRRNYELYDYEELGRGEPVFKDDAEATHILELVRYANVHNQKPLVDEELKFIATYPEIAKKIFTMAP
jgi:homocitrate synthase NifV